MTRLIYSLPPSNVMPMSDMNRLLYNSDGCPVSIVKVSTDFMICPGSHALTNLQSYVKYVFFDFKLNDTPDTLERTCNTLLAFYKTTLIRTLAISVTLTPDVDLSFASKNKSIRLAGFISPTSLPLQPEKLIRLTDQHRSNLEFIITSAEGLNVLNKHWEDTDQEPLKSIVPGVRDSNKAKQDQVDTSTPEQVCLSGATYAVVGRQITKSVDPKVTLKDLKSRLKGNTPYCRYIP